jgi:hypothetical protein
MAARKELSNEEKPTVRIRRQRELLGQMHHENEVLRLDLTRESRESRRALGSTETREISNLQEQASMYLRKIEAERRKVEDLERQVRTQRDVWVFVPHLVVFVLPSKLTSCTGHR